MNFFDEATSTILALIAKNPSQGEQLLEKLEGEALAIGQALIDIESTNDTAIKDVARAILEWANSAKRETEQRRDLVVSKRVHA